MAEASSYKFSDIFHVGDWPDGRDIFAIAKYDGKSLDEHKTQRAWYGRMYAGGTKCYILQDVRREMNLLIDRNNASRITCWCYLDDLFQFATAKGVIPIQPGEVVRETIFTESNGGSDASTV